jgi:hypothetical protein
MAPVAASAPPPACAATVSGLNPSAPLGLDGEKGAAAPVLRAFPFGLLPDGRLAGATLSGGGSNDWSDVLAVTHGSSAEDT